jgi:hypothetical protein
MLGVRLALHTAELRQPFLEGHYDWMWEELERLGIPVMVLIHHAYMPMVDAIAAKHPRLKIVIDHLGLVNGEKDDVAFRGLDGLLALGKRAHVAVKSSALPCYSAEAYPYPGLQNHLKRVYDAFGNRRMFWGTDQTSSPVSYRKGVVLATPASLFGILKSLAFTWRQEDLAENAREVVSMGQTLFNRLSSVATHASKLGRSIERSVKDYNAFAGSMQTQLLTQARRFDGMEFETPKEIEEGTRQFTATEFAALEEIEGVERPELELFDEIHPAQVVDEADTA